MVVAAVVAVTAACSSESQVSVSTDLPASTETVVAAPSVSASPTTVPASEAPTTAEAPPSTAPPTTESHTGSKQDGDCVPPQQFRDVDADGWGVCFLPDDAVEAPEGDTIVAVPGSVNIVQSGVNVTIEVSNCRGNGADGTVVITAELSYFGGSTIDRGTVNMQLLDTGGGRATVAALLVSVPPRTPVQLEFATAGTDSPARAIGEIQACWFDRVNDVTFFTGL